MPWFNDLQLMEILETVKIAADRNFENFRFPVQYVNRPNLDFRGFCGTVASGKIHPGDEIMALPSRQVSTAREIVTFDGSIEARQAIRHQIGHKRGNRLCAKNSSSDQCQHTGKR